jgi:tetratricopeptide (TPR) repeat protein
MLRLAAQAQPENASAHSNLGWALLGRGLEQDAEASFQRALKLDEGMALAHAGQAEVLHARGETSAAERKYLEALDHDPQLADAYGRLVVIYRQQSRMEDAVAILERAFAQGVDADGMHYKLGQCLLGVGRVADAIEQFGAELELDPDHLQSLNNLARILATHPDPALRDGERAVELAQRAVAGRGAENPYSQGAMATALAETGRFDEALIAVEQALVLARAAQREALVGQLESERQSYQSGNPARMQ